MRLPPGAFRKNRFIILRVTAAGPIYQKEQSISHLHEHNSFGLTNQVPLIPPIPSMFHPQLKQTDRAPDERSSHLYREAQSR